MCCRTQKNHQILQKLWENKENLTIFTVILMAAFGTKNIHSAMAQKLVPSTNVLKMLFKL